jgi:hypothetical protein
MVRAWPADASAIVTSPARAKVVLKYPLGKAFSL